MKRICETCHMEFYSHPNPRRRCFTCYPLDVNLSALLADYASGMTVARLTHRYPHLGFNNIRCLIVNYGQPRLKGPKTNTQPVHLDLEWFDGWLLGDGNLQRKRSEKSSDIRVGNAICQHGSSKRPYTQYVVAKWLAMGLTTNGKIYANAKKNCPDEVKYSAQTHSHPILTSQYHRWYPNDVKSIPRDFQFTPTVFREWYLGDGFLSGGAPCFKLGGLTRSDADYLYRSVAHIFGQVSLHEITTETQSRFSQGVIWKPQYTIYIAKELSYTFFSYIGPSPISCYQYKWLCGF